MLREDGLLERRNEAVAQQPPEVGGDGKEQELDEEGACEEHLLRVIEQLEEWSLYCRGASASNVFPHMRK